jgi:hypothetical protein
VQHCAPQHQDPPAVYSDACKAQYQVPYSIVLLGLCVLLTRPVTIRLYIHMVHQHCARCAFLRKPMLMLHQS